MRKTGNEIVDRLAKVHKNYAEALKSEPGRESNWDHVPTDPDEFLDWWWETRASNCQRCSLAEGRNSVVKPDGIASASIMILGEGPGFLEDLAVVPLVGPLELRGARCATCSEVNKCYSSKLLASTDSRLRRGTPVVCNQNETGKQVLTSRKFYLQSAGSVLDGILMLKWGMAFPRHNWIQTYNKNHQNNPSKGISPWYISNSTLCRSTDPSRTRDQTPPPLAWRECREHLAMQYAAVDPKVIVALGRVAMSAILGQNADSVRPNQVLDTKFGPVIFQMHPAAFMREPVREVKAHGFARVGSSLELALKIAGFDTKPYEVVPKRRR